MEINWETYEGETHGYDEAGNEVLWISARTRHNKWGDSDSNVRTWTVSDENNDIIAKGTADGLRAAKRDALAALKNS